MKYFDFHCHSVFKQVFDENPNMQSFINRSDVPGIVQLCTDLPNIIQTQIHPSQLAEFQDEVLVGVVLYSLESFLAAEVINLRKVLKGSSRHKLSLQLLQDVAKGKYKSFSEFILDRSLTPYLESQTTFNVIKSESFSNLLPKNKVNIFFVIEGCHSLVDTSNRFLPPDQSFPVGEIIANLDKLLQKVNILSINLTHLQQSNLCNHAFGIQLTKVEPFVPKGNGMQQDGLNVAAGIFKRGICVDLKHMSFKSRRDLMQAIDNGSIANPQPLVCTHSGFTGIPFNDWASYISLKKPAASGLYLELAKTIHSEWSPVQPGAPTFNSSSINLFNEEIVWIVKHGGVIGISMDRRILGYVDKFDNSPTGVREDNELIVDTEFFSKDEWTALGIKNSEIGKKIENGDCLTMTQLEENTEISISARNEYFFDHFLLHLKHYLQVCHDAGISIDESSSHICIGSDFDGLINPFLNTPTVKEMADLRKYISMNFQFYLQSLSDAKLWADQLDVDSFLDKLFYNNGYNFVKKRMTT